MIRVKIPFLSKKKLTEGEKALWGNVAATLPPGQTMDGVRAGWKQDGSYVMTWPCPTCGVHEGHSPTCGAEQ